ncbi:MAG: imidazole glycerol phosphate synthase subunit HisH [Sediminibacterium sp.]|nr:imidazole glycerol phosphate synthase subunit HisH [Sediminibacterium sp.]
MRTKKVVIIDYGIGNVKSMCNAFYNIGVEPILTADKQTILNANALVLPGVGAFQKGMANLHSAGLVETIHEYVKKGNPFLGVCLGMQMLMQESEEFGITPGLGLIKGKVVRLPLAVSLDEKLPHVSWNELHEPSPGRWKNTILHDLPQKTDVYFVHSFVVVPEKLEDLLTTTNYGGVDFCSSIHHENIYGTQFHPEKSSEKGQVILNNFINLIK